MTTNLDTLKSFFTYVTDTVTKTIKRIAFTSDVQIGTRGKPAELQLLGRLSFNVKDHVINRTNKGIINIDNNDTIVNITLQEIPVSGRITLFLPANPRDGQLHFVKDMTGTADTIPIDIIPPSGVYIDQYTIKTLIDKYGSLALYWFGDQWRMLVSGLGPSGGGGAANDSSYITVGSSSLENGRILSAGTGITFTDGGPGSFLTITSTASGSGGGGVNAVVTGSSYYLETNWPKWMSGSGTPQMAAAFSEFDGCSFVVTRDCYLAGASFWLSSSVARNIQIGLWNNVAVTNPLVKKDAIVGPGQGIFSVYFNNPIPIDQERIGAYMILGMIMTDSGSRPTVVSISADGRFPLVGTTQPPTLIHPCIGMIKWNIFSGNSTDAPNPSSSAGTERYPIAPIILNVPQYLTGVTY